jgi:formylglycine-generating enzyme required for sulfatase activity
MTRTTPNDAGMTGNFAALPPEMPLLQYRIVRQVGAGGMGVVYLARDTELDRDVALKVLRIEVIPPADLARFQDRFVREARSAARLNHPNVASIFQVGRADGRLFLAMEWLSGGSLADYLRDHFMLDWRAAATAVRDAAAGLAAAHAAGLVHRDIKPSNLMRTGTGAVKLVDFGLARDFASEPDLTTAGVVLGTPTYLSPEQCRGERATPQSDVYGLACTWFHLLTSRPPFHADSLPGILHQHLYEPLPDPRRFAGDIPESVRQVLARAAAKNPAERHASAAAFLDDLQALLDGRPVAAALHSSHSSESGPGLDETKRAAVASAPKSRRGWLVAIAILALLTTATLVAWSAGWLERSPAARSSVSPAPAPPAAPLLTSRTYANPIGLDFVRIESSTFLMGSPAAELERFDDETLHQVTLTHPYYIATTKVSQAQWKRLMGSNPSHFIGDDLPVEQITVDEATEFCKRLGALDGRTYRLPTEAEWEYAARAGMTTPFGIGAMISSDAANYNGKVQSGLSAGSEFREKTTPVKQFAPNRWGLYDMQGNLLEICQDWHGELAAAPAIDPHGPAAGTYHVARGGSWTGMPRWCRAAARGRCVPGQRTNKIGLRVLMDAGG